MVDCCLELQEKVKAAGISRLFSHNQLGGWRVGTPDVEEIVEMSKDKRRLDFLLSYQPDMNGNLVPKCGTITREHIDSVLGEEDKDYHNG